MQSTQRERITDAIVNSVNHGSFNGLIDLLLEVSDAPPPPPAPSMPLPDAEEVARIICQNFRGISGQKIAAIKAHRALTGNGLKESKDAIEKYMYLSAAFPETR